MIYVVYIKYNLHTTPVFITHQYEMHAEHWYCHGISVRLSIQCCYWL